MTKQITLRTCLGLGIGFRGFRGAGFGVQGLGIGFRSLGLRGLGA